MFYEKSRVVFFSKEFDLIFVMAVLGLSEVIINIVDDIMSHKKISFEKLKEYLVALCIWTTNATIGYLAFISYEKLDLLRFIPGEFFKNLHNKKHFIGFISNCLFVFSGTYGAIMYTPISKVKKD